MTEPRASCPPAPCPAVPGIASCPGTAPPGTAPCQLRRLTVLTASGQHSRKPADPTAHSAGRVAWRARGAREPPAWAAWTPVLTPPGRGPAAQAPDTGQVGPHHCGLAGESFRAVEQRAYPIRIGLAAFSAAAAVSIGGPGFGVPGWPDVGSRRDLFLVGSAAVQAAGFWPSVDLDLELAGGEAVRCRARPARAAGAGARPRNAHGQCGGGEVARPRREPECPPWPAQAVVTTGIRARAEGRRAHGSVNRFADAENPLVQQTAARLCQGCRSSREQVERFVSFARDDIKFGFPPAADWTSASQTLQSGIGQCNTKGTLLPALCDAAGIPARLHFAPIRSSIQRGLYTGLWYLLLPGTCRTPGWKQTLTGDGGGSMPTSTTTPSARRLHASPGGTAGRRDAPWPAPIAAGKPSTLTPSSSSRWKPWKAMAASGPSQPIITRALTTGTGPDRSGPCSTVTSSQA